MQTKPWANVVLAIFTFAIGQLMALTLIFNVHGNNSPKKRFTASSVLAATFENKQVLFFEIWDLIGQNQTSLIEQKSDHLRQLMFKSSQKESVDITHYFYSDLSVYSDTFGNLGPLDELMILKWREDALKLLALGDDQGFLDIITMEKDYFGQLMNEQYYNSQTLELDSKLLTLKLQSFVDALAKSIRQDGLDKIRKVTEDKDKTAFLNTHTKREMDQLLGLMSTVDLSKVILGRTFVPDFKSETMYAIYNHPFNLMISDVELERFYTKLEETIDQEKQDDAEIVEEAKQNPFNVAIRNQKRMDGYFLAIAPFLDLLSFVIELEKNALLELDKKDSTSEAESNTAQSNKPQFSSVQMASVETENLAVEITNFSVVYSLNSLLLKNQETAFYIDCEHDQFSVQKGQEMLLGRFLDKPQCLKLFGSLHKVKDHRQSRLNVDILKKTWDGKNQESLIQKVTLDSPKLLQTSLSHRSKKSSEKSELPLYFNDRYVVSAYNFDDCLFYLSFNRRTRDLTKLAITEKGTLERLENGITCPGGKISLEVDVTLNSFVEQIQSIERSTGKRVLAQKSTLQVVPDRLQSVAKNSMLLDLVASTGIIPDDQEYKGYLRQTLKALMISYPLAKRHVSPYSLILK